MVRCQIILTRAALMEGSTTPKEKPNFANEKLYEPLNHIMIFVVFNSLPYLVIVKKNVQYCTWHTL